MSKGKKENEIKDVKTKIVKKKIEDFLNNTYISILFMTITLWALFADDFRVLTVNKSQDLGFYYVTTVVMVLFFIELTL